MVETESNRKNIALIGFMATGKTSVARHLAKKLGMEFIDIDRAIEDKMEMSIAEIFEKYGEKYFRQIEKNIIEEKSQLENMIISCGGGVCLDPDNIINIRKKSTVILLEADLETILNRTREDTTRPLLKNKNAIGAIEKLMDERKDSYHRAADIIIDTGKKSILEVRDEILGKLKLENKIVK